jgi:hypothetical protein
MSFQVHLETSDARLCHAVAASAAPAAVLAAGAQPYRHHLEYVHLPPAPCPPQPQQYYFHYLYKMREAPPFEPCALSAELPLVFRKPRAPDDPKAAIQRQRIWKDTSRTAFVSGLHLEGAPPAALPGGRTGAGLPRLLISYGSSDIDSRLLVLSLEELEGLFKGQPSTC